MPTLKINDITMYYELEGEGEPLVFISGFAGDHTIWSGVTSLLKNKYKILVFDNRGSGQTDAPNQDYSIEQMAADVVELCRQLHIEKATFVGNSMGGCIVQMLAYQYPTLVKAAIISCSAMNTKAPFRFYLDAQLELLKANAPLSTLIKSSCSWTFSFQFLSQPGVLETIIEKGLNDPFPFSVEGYQGQYAALNNFNSEPWISQITAPSLVIGAEQDLVFSEPSVRALASKIPDSTYICFKKCGHCPYAEYPTLFANAVDDFIIRRLVST